MRTLRAVLTALAVIGSTLVAIPAAEGVPDPKLTVTSVTLGRTSVAVSGMNTVPVSVRVKASYDSDSPYVSLVVFLKRTAGTGQLVTMIAVDLARVAGTTQDGEWLGTLDVPSTANGTFQVSAVQVGPYTVNASGNNPIDPTPFTGPDLTVAGFHLPKLSASVVPRVVPFGSGFTVRGAVTDSATGKPYGTGIRIRLLAAAWCKQIAVSDGPRSNTAGVVEASYAGGLADSVTCVRLINGPFDKLSLTFLVARPGIVAAVPSKASAPVGTVVPVNGSVAGAPAGCLVVLQRLLGATQWRTASQAPVRSSGRFTVLAQPPYAGNVLYRVSFPTCTRYQAGVSKSFVIRGL
jgi:hypothetical protein